MVFYDADQEGKGVSLGGDASFDEVDIRGIPYLCLESPRDIVPVPFWYFRVICNGVCRIGRNVIVMEVYKVEVMWGIFINKQKGYLVRSRNKLHRNASTGF